jgi:hypothetical protein
MCLADGYHGKGCAGVSRLTVHMCASWQTARDWRLRTVMYDTKVPFCPALPDTQKISVFRSIVLCSLFIYCTKQLHVSAVQAVNENKTETSLLCGLRSQCLTDIRI